DEAHRFALTYQRLRRAKRTVTSELLRIPGVGAARRRQLLQTFGSLEGVRGASAEAIAALPGFSLKNAQRILDLLHGRTPAHAANGAAASQEMPQMPESAAANDANDGSNPV